MSTPASSPTPPTTTSSSASAESTEMKFVDVSDDAERSVSKWNMNFAQVEFEDGSSFHVGSPTCTMHIQTYDAAKRAMRDYFKGCSTNCLAIEARFPICLPMHTAYCWMLTMFQRQYMFMVFRDDRDDPSSVSLTMKIAPIHFVNKSPVPDGWTCGGCHTRNVKQQLNCKQCGVFPQFGSVSGRTGNVTMSAEDVIPPWQCYRPYSWSTAPGTNHPKVSPPARDIVVTRDVTVDPFIHIDGPHLNGRFDDDGSVPVAEFTYNGAGGIILNYDPINDTGIPPAPSPISPSALIIRPPLPEADIVEDAAEDAVDPSLRCCTCLAVFVDPRIVCLSGCSVCLTCIDKHKRTKAAASQTAKCPLCCEPLINTSIPNLDKRERISQLPTTCKYKCGWTGRRCELDAHYQRVCTVYDKLKCPNKCLPHQRYTRSTLDDHVANHCPNRIVPCPPIMSSRQSVVKEAEKQVHIAESNLKHAYAWLDQMEKWSLFVGVSDGSISDDDAWGAASEEKPLDFDEDWHWPPKRQMQNAFIRYTDEKGYNLLEVAALANRSKLVDRFIKGDGGYRMKGADFAKDMALAGVSDELMRIMLSLPFYKM